MKTRTNRETPRPLATLRAIARLMDDAVEIPVLGIRVGLDPLLGLLPEAGDLVSFVISGWTVVAAARLGASPAVIARMLLNLGVDALVGAVPLLGDLFDFGFKANRRNLRLVEDHVADPAGTRGRSLALVVGAALGVLALLAGLAALMVWTTSLVWGVVLG